mmetsp:Transcript_7195/g.17878  ORF Transcript_7195/g.17878 Transcript_7195/m.17878 type:complete len:205 (-) Transcript_7195:466-1080(-)
MPHTMMTNTAHNPSAVVCLFQMTQLTSSEMNLLHVATTDTDVALIASRIHMVATDIPRPITHDATSSDIVFVDHCTLASKACPCSPIMSNCARARGMESTLILYERLQLLSFTFSMVVLATRPSLTAATRKTAQNMYALVLAKASTFTYCAAPRTIPTSAAAERKFGSDRPKKRYSHTQNSTGVMDLTVMNVSRGAYFITSMPA